VDLLTVGAPDGQHGRNMTSRERRRLTWALSWLVVGAVGLAPILFYWVAGLIGGAFRPRRGGPPAGSEPVQGQHEGKGAHRREAAPPGLPPT
jgi:hypothetical protein